MCPRGIRYDQPDRTNNEETGMFQKALLTLDRSAFAEAAIPALASARPASVVLLGVMESVASVLSRDLPAFDVSPDVAAKIQQSERAAVRAHLDAAAVRLKELGFEDVRTVIGEGRAGPRIVETAAAEGCDLVVMSTHGRSGIQRALLGSVANYVVNHLPNGAVLLVRPPAPEH
jgi:nucleotide-binding universal stress UspA family protein